VAAAKRLICLSTDLAESGDGVRFDMEYQGKQQSAFVIRHRGQVHAYLNRCAHVGVELDWQAGKFFDTEKMHLICSTHGAVYAPENGRCLGGPCQGAALVSLSIEERDGQIILTEYD
jgi:nitrite reductase/ring-hydroxylating ferredoxin subunit